MKCSKKMAENFMNDLIIGKTYKNGKLTRTITNINGYNIEYKTNKGVIKSCWVTTFLDWVKKGEKSNEQIETSVKYKYILTPNESYKIATGNDKDIVIEDNESKNLDNAKQQIKTYKESNNFSKVQLIEEKVIKTTINI